MSEIKQRSWHSIRDLYGTLQTNTKTREFRTVGRHNTTTPIQLGVQKFKVKFIVVKVIQEATRLLAVHRGSIVKDIDYERKHQC